MTYFYSSSQSRFNSGHRVIPSMIKKLVICIVSISLFSALFTKVFHEFHFLGPQDILSLSWHGLKKFCLWQPITYILVPWGGEKDISFDLLFTLTIQMYFFWVFGSDLCERKGKISFMTFFFASTIFSGLASISIIHLFDPSFSLCGMTPTLIAILIGWTFMYPNSNIVFLFPLKMEWLLGGFLGFHLLSSMVQTDLVDFFYWIIPPLFSYLYILFFWHLKSPFPKLHHFENVMIRYGRFFQEKKESIKTFLSFNFFKKPLDHNEKYIDDMLSKISKKGIHSLTFLEKLRLKITSKLRKFSSKTNS